MNINHKDLSVIMSSFFMFAGSMWYIRQILRKEVSPVLPAWIVLGGTLSLSLVTYLSTASPSLISNIGATVSMGSGVSILLVLLVLNLGKLGEASFSWTQKFCLWASLVIAAIWMADVWILKDKSSVPYYLTQVLMLIGYFLNIQKLWTRKKNTDSFVLWSGICISGIFSLDVATISGDEDAFYFSARSVLCSGITIYIMCMVEMRNRITKT